mmetsp:Transcript_53273/g.169210  ORF Transcript_53273/g.169210 Transcript_53273/m.169210 type:complete len:333 (-) Transcript_53273:667-1665(-)
MAVHIGGEPGGIAGLAQEPGAFIRPTGHCPRDFRDSPRDLRGAGAHYREHWGRLAVRGHQKAAGRAGVGCYGQGGGGGARRRRRRRRDGSAGAGAERIPRGGVWAASRRRTGVPRLFQESRLAQVRPGVFEKPLRRGPGFFQVPGLSQEGEAPEGPVPRRARPHRTRPCRRRARLGDGQQAGGRHGTRSGGGARCDPRVVPHQRLSLRLLVVHPSRPALPAPHDLAPCVCRGRHGVPRAPGVGCGRAQPLLVPGAAPLLGGGEQHHARAHPPLHRIHPRLRPVPLRRDRLRRSARPVPLPGDPRRAGGGRGGAALCGVHGQLIVRCLPSAPP